MSSTEKQFKKNLEYGELGEDLVHHFLISTFDYVEDNRFQRRDYKAGPKLRGRKAGRSGINLPDFTAYNSGQPPILIDAKVKTKPFNLDGKLYFAVDDYKFDDYLQCAQIKGAVDVWIAIIYNSDIYIYTSADIKKRHVFNNEYGNAAYLFEFDVTKIIKF